MQEAMTIDVPYTNLQIIIAKKGVGFKVKELQQQIALNSNDDDEIAALNTFFQYVRTVEAMTKADTFLEQDFSEIKAMFARMPAPNSVSPNWATHIEDITCYKFPRPRATSDSPSESSSSSRPLWKKKKHVSIGEQLRKDGTIHKVRKFYGRRTLYEPALIARKDDGTLSKWGSEFVPTVFYKTLRSPSKGFGTRWVDILFCREAAKGMEDAGILFPGRGRGTPAHMRQDSLAEILRARIENGRRTNNLKTVRFPLAPPCPTC